MLYYIENETGAVVRILNITANDVRFLCAPKAQQMMGIDEFAQKYRIMPENLVPLTEWDESAEDPIAQVQIQRKRLRESQDRVEHLEKTLTDLLEGIEQLDGTLTNLLTQARSSLTKEQ